MTINFELPAWLIGVLLGGMALAWLRRKGYRAPQLLFFSIFWFHLLCVVNWTLFPIYIIPARAMQGHFMDNVNLIPFHFGPGMILAYALPGILLNTLLTMPIGFGVNFVTRFRPRDLPWLVAIFGLGIEGPQLLISLSLGYPYRAIDVNDGIFNSPGVLLGYGVFRAFAWVYATATDRLKLRHKGLLLYVYEMSNQKEVIQ